MVVLWAVASFCFYLISYEVKYLHGDLFINGIVSSASECIAYGISGIVKQRFGLRPCLVVSYFIGAIGMLGLIFVKTENQFWLSLFVLGSKFGISLAFGLVYLANAFMFPVSIVASTYGICGVFARIVTIFSPYVAEIKPEVIPEWFFVAFTGVAMVVSFRIRDSKFK